MITTEKLIILYDALRDGKYVNDTTSLSSKKENMIFLISKKKHT